MRSLLEGLMDPRFLTPADGGPGSRMDPVAGAEAATAIAREMVRLCCGRR
jgi:hypothetical protein